MKDSSLNIINIDDLPVVRKSSKRIVMPKRNTLVTVTILERLNNGVKVLIDGKLFIAIVSENVELQEELIAWVSDNEKLELSLNLSNQYNSSSNYILDQIISKLGLINNISTNAILAKIIEERKPVIKSKVKLLLAFISDNKMELSDSQLSLLINILWSERGNSTKLAEELFENLFVETFEIVSNNLFEATKEIIYTKIPSFILKQINKTIYDEKLDNTIALNGKRELIIEAIKNLNNNLLANKNVEDKEVIEKYIEYGVKYILQKSALQHFDYFPDFVIAKNGNGLLLIMLEIKKYYSNNGEAFYNIIFKHNAIPIELKGIIRNQFLSSNVIVNIKNNEVVSEKIKNFQNELKTNWEINSHITLNETKNSKLIDSQLESGINAFA